MRFISIIVLGVFLTSSNICEEYDAYVESVYDGDTITCNIEIGFDVYTNQKVRLYGIDAPEVRGVERPQGLASRDSLKALILGKNVVLHNKGRGKYGRVIAEVFADTINVSDWLVRKGLAEYKDY